MGREDGDKDTPGRGNGSGAATDVPPEAAAVPTEEGAAQAAEALELIDQLEQDDDVQRVFHTLA